MTSFLLEIGYISGATYNEGAEGAWAELLQVVERVKRDKSNLWLWVRCHGICPQQDEVGNTLEAYVDQYTKEEFCPLSIREDSVCVGCSGGGVSRTMKEHVARAFCRLVIDQMHAKGISVCLTEA